MIVLVLSQMQAYCNVAEQFCLDDKNNPLVEWQVKENYIQCDLQMRICDISQSIKWEDVIYDENGKYETATNITIALQNLLQYSRSQSQSEYVKQVGTTESGACETTLTDDVYIWVCPSTVPSRQILNDQTCHLAQRICHFNGPIPSLVEKVYDEDYIQLSYLNLDEGNLVLQNIIDFGIRRYALSTTLKNKYAYCDITTYLNMYFSCYDVDQNKFENELFFDLGGCCNYNTTKGGDPICNDFNNKTMQKIINTQIKGEGSEDDTLSSLKKNIEQLEKSYLKDNTSIANTINNGRLYIEQLEKQYIEDYNNITNMILEDSNVKQLITAAFSLMGINTLIAIVALIILFINVVNVVKILVNVGIRVGLVNVKVINQKFNKLWYQLQL